ncbi:hypothetical protein [Amycolatopsis decaplanina]|uniref:hypothetical protein n=1 Tax=Amycolatopsis decaplanina TaxID=208441 RepID=UPI000347FFE3|nr:hypothetical protein [Amycolatopsis decaplanina]
MYLSLSEVFAQVPGSWTAVAEAIVSTAAIGVVLGLRLVVLRRTESRAPELEHVATRERS